MRIIGYCEVCRRIRPVSLRSPGMVALVVQGVATGVCADCETPTR